MNKNRYKILPIVILLIFVLGITSIYASEHKIEDINIEVNINQDGSARIKETRIANLVEGTENFIIINNLGKSKIKDFRVFEQGKEFQYVDNWDINASRQSKTNKNGIVNTYDGYELCWGIGEYGRHEYILEYTVTNFVKGLQDSQMVSWEFVNDGTNIPPEKVRVSIFSDNEFSDENEKVWGFGFDGNVVFDKGKVVATSNRQLSSNEHVTILLKLPQGMFDTGDIINKNFDEIRDKAFIGSDYNKSEKGPLATFFTFISILIPVLLVLAFIIALIVGNSKLTSQTPTTFKRQFKEEYYRDYPYEGDFLDIYYIPYLMGATNFEKLLTGFILKWINEDRVMTVEKEVGWIFKKDETNLKFIKTSPLSNPLEQELFQIMLSAAGANEILEEKEFTKWAGKNITKINNWEKEIKESSRKKLVELGYVEVLSKKIVFSNVPDYVLTEKGKELRSNIYKYINYLYDFSLLNEHEAINVRIWDRIMIWAGFLGLTEVVSKQFEKLYPNYTQETVYRGNSIYLTSHLARNMSQAKVSAARSSGSGGSTSIGGGGGSFGGGSGGGTR